MSDYKISVLVTFYNQEDYVDKALNSIFSQQTTFKYKVIIGDDGSSDNTISLIKKWQNKYSDIEIIIRNHDDGCTIGGFRASRNRLALLKRVSTKYFIFLDGDDYFCDNNKLQMQYNLLELEKNNDCIACAHEINALYSDGSVKPYSLQNVNEGKYDVKEYWRKYYFHTDTILFRSTLIKKIDFELLENNYNDNMITYSALQFGKIYYIPKCMAIYNQTGDGIWTTGNQITNNIRNMFLFDICNVINPKLHIENDIRFGCTWFNLIKLRRKIKSNEYTIYINEAKEKKLKFSVMWLNYNESTLLNKIKLFCKAISVILCRYIFKIKRKLLSLFDRRI